MESDVFTRMGSLSDLSRTQETSSEGLYDLNFAEAFTRATLYDPLASNTSKSAENATYNLSKQEGLLSNQLQDVNVNLLSNTSSTWSDLSAQDYTRSETLNTTLSVRDAINNTLSNVLNGTVDFFTNATAIDKVTNPSSIVPTNDQYIVNDTSAHVDVSTNISSSSSSSSNSQTNTSGVGNASVGNNSSWPPEAATSLISSTRAQDTWRVLSDAVTRVLGTGTEDSAAVNVTGTLGVPSLDTASFEPSHIDPKSTGSASNTTAVISVFNFTSLNYDNLTTPVSGVQGMEVTFPCTGSYPCLDTIEGAIYNLTNESQSRDDHTDEGSHWHVLLLLLVVVAGITGNVLVCIAVSIEKKLQNVTNYFLVSLAVADLFVSLVVMPCSIVHELVGYWPFGLVMCDIWQVTDVMMCTSSIMHMCTISLDRYIAIRHPLKVRNKSRTVVGIKIATVWLISLAIASPIILLSLLNPENVLSGGDCAIFNRYFLIYGSLAAFFIPLIIMLIAYSLTIHILHKQAKMCAKKSKYGAPMMRRSTSRRQKRTKRSSNQLTETQEKHDKNEKQSTSNGLRLARKIQSHLDRNKATPSEKEPLAHSRPDGLETEPSPSPLIARLRATEDTSEPSGNGSSAGSQGFRRADGGPRLQALVKKHSAAIKVAGILIAKRQENEKNQLNNVKTERKAVKVLGTMFGTFVLCWGPFFSLNFAMGVCESCNIEVTLFKVFLWCGYVSSTLNPIIYTVFNKTFKQTFIQILRCRCTSEESQPITYTTANGTSLRVKYDQQVSASTNESMV